MSATVLWDVPTTLVATTSYTITVYRAASEDGTYAVVTSLSSKDSTGANVSSYVDSSGSQTQFYYVTYTAAGGTEGDILPAITQPTVRGLRMVKEFKEEIPPVIRKGLDSHDRQIYAALSYALKGLNAMSPVTSYNITNMPSQYEPAVRLGALVFFYSMQYLKVAIRDFSYGVAGISLNIDRGARVNTALQNALRVYSDLVKNVKMLDYPDAIGLGSYAISTPSQRVMGFLFGASSSL